MKCKSDIQFRPRPKAHAGQGGVVLLEALVAMVIFTVGMLGLIGLQARAIKNSQDIQIVGTAAVLANELITNVYGLSSNGSIDKSSAAYIGWTNRVKAALPGGEGVAVFDPQNVTVTGATGSDTYTQMTILVTISWKMPGGTKRTYTTRGSANNW